MRARVEEEVEQIWTASAPLRAIDPWCVRLPQRPELLWEADGVSVAGFGVAAERTFSTAPGLEWVEALQRPVEADGGQAPPGPWFGGLAFDLAREPGPSWKGFPCARFRVPRVLVTRQGDVSWLWAFAMGPDGRREALRRLESAQKGLNGAAVAEERPVTLDLRSDRQAWDALVENALAAIRRGELQKVVAARCLEVTADRLLDGWSCAQLLRARAGEAASFLIQGTNGSVFLGATPERLVRVEGDRLETQALASSARLAQSAALAREDKEQREHSAVVEDIRASLGPLCSRLTLSAEPRLLELPYIAHLRTPVQATLRSGVGVSQVLAALYPTAAVGGTPRRVALQFLREQEGLDRGWYAGAVGWIGPRGADLHVAIRSGWVNGTQARVFVGAGLVAGSVAEREWQETEDKARPFLRALGGAGALP